MEAPIRVIDGLLAVRRRPAIYIAGDTPVDRLHTLITEAVVCAADPKRSESQSVMVTSYAAGCVCVQDDGAGLPLDPVHDGNISHPRAEIGMLTLHGKEGSFAQWGQLARFGAVLNALCERLVVHTRIDADEYRAVFSRGMIMTPFHTVNATLDVPGTRLMVTPDRDIFGDIDIDCARLAETISDAQEDNWADVTIESKRDVEIPSW